MISFKRLWLLAQAFKHESFVMFKRLSLLGVFHRLTRINLGRHDIIAS